MSSSPPALHSADHGPTDKHSPSGALADLEELIHHAAHYLPSQGPIQVFVHHNTLHTFEDFPFEVAVKEGAVAYGCQPFLTEAQYLKHLNDGRILISDLSAVLLDDLGEESDRLIGLLGTRLSLRLAMLQHPLRVASDAELNWYITESDALGKFMNGVSPQAQQRMVDATRRYVLRDLGASSGNLGDSDRAPQAKLDDGLGAAVRETAPQYRWDQIEFWTPPTWESFTLNLLWRVCLRGASGHPTFKPVERAPTRHRDLLFQVTGADADELVHELLIPFCASFLDQGMATWSLPDRDAGFYRAFYTLHHDAATVTPSWQRSLKDELFRIERAGMTPLESIRESLELLGVPAERQSAFLTDTMLALRGWSGMVWQMETNAEWIPRPAPPGTLVEMLAVRLVLDRLALAAIAQETLDYHGSLAQLWDDLSQRVPRRDGVNVEQRAFRLFQLAQQLGWSPQDLARMTRDEWGMLIKETESFSGWERRRIYHLAFERRYRNQVLDAVTNHNEKPNSTPPTPRFQLITCIDEREESFRRHLEEQAPDCETFGVAGFFGVAMYYRGLAEAHYVPLCPIVIKPSHYVVEDVGYVFEEEQRRKELTRRMLGRATHRWHLGSRSFLAGVLTSLVGSVASIPLVARILFPRLAAQIRRTFGKLVRPPAVTQLQLERTAAEPSAELDHIGFSVPEMANIVERVLRDIGLTKNFSSIILIVGHGSASMNNPHRAAYDCGACGGGQGGPNARAFARMANDPRVRQLLSGRGLHLPFEVYFVGALHNTCDDSMTYFDLELLPVTHRKAFREVREAIDRTRQWNAHERCRRFESAPLTFSPEAALKHVEARAEDLSQTRPECGHATNAICIVGRRVRTRDLFLDRRSFLTSYDPTQDDSQATILTRILQAVIPVCAGINLEYYFSYVDSTGWGCGTKLPHNITSLIGVMDGAASDLRPGLPWQMVEIHEPVRLLFIIETTPAVMEAIMAANPAIERLCRNSWVQLATLDPHSSQIHHFVRGEFQPYQRESQNLPSVSNSVEWYRGSRHHLGLARIEHASPTTASPSDSAKVV